RRHPEQLRHPRRAAHAPGAARLPHRAVRRRRLEPQEAPPPDHALRDVPTEQPVRRGERPGRCGQPVPLADESAPPGVEPWRAAVPAVADNLAPKTGGPSLDLASATNNRRTLYGAVSRHNLNPLLRLFDFPDPNLTSDRRPVTSVPLQQLFVLNSDFMA